MDEIDKIIDQRISENQVQVVEATPSVNEIFSQEDELKKLQTAIVEETKDTHKSLSEKAKDYVGVVATIEAVKDEHLVGDVATLKKEEIKSHAQAEAQQEKVNAKEAEKKLQEAEYGTYKGSAEYAGIKKPLPDKMQKALFPILCVIQSLFLLAFGTVASIINIIGDCINSVVERISTLTKTAKGILITAGAIGILYLGYIILKQVLGNYGIII